MTSSTVFMPNWRADWGERTYATSLSSVISSCAPCSSTPGASLDHRSVLGLVMPPLRPPISELLAPSADLDLQAAKMLI